MILLLFEVCIIVKICKVVAWFISCDIHFFLFFFQRVEVNAKPDVLGCVWHPE